MEYFHYVSSARTSQCENEVRRIVSLEEIVNRLPDAFYDAAKVTKSHVPAMNALARINVPVGPSQYNSICGRYINIKGK